jgi:hypothetical protein
MSLNDLLTKVAEQITVDDVQNAQKEANKMKSDLKNYNNTVRRMFATDSN